MRKRIRKIFLNYIPALIRSSLLSKMPGLYPLLEIKPTSCTIMVTDRCNLKCVMCKQWRSPRRDELSTRQWKEVLSSLRKNGIRNIHYTGGEPLLRQDLAELVKYASENSFTVGLTTNGILLNKTVLDELVKNGLRSIVISIDAVEDEYEKIRGAPDMFLKVSESARLIAETRKTHRIDASINYTLMSDTIEAFGSVCRFAEKLDLPVAICLLDRNSYIYDTEDNKYKFWIREGKDLDELLHMLMRQKIKNPGSLALNFPGIDYIGRYFKDPLQKKIPCVSSQDRIIIDPGGDLLGGCLSMGTFGNVAKTDLGILLNEKQYRKAKKNMFYKNCAGCSCGYFFNIKCMPGLIVRDLFRRIYHFAVRV